MTNHPGAGVVRLEPLGPDDPRYLGPFRLVGQLGSGGMGAVYAGVDPEGGCAAVKVIHPQFAANPEFLARFTREVELVSRVRANCTAAFCGADTRAATPWLATEYVPGRTLRQHVNEHGPLSGGMLTALAAGLAEALAAIHEAGVVHRDLKPGNVILSPDGPKVLDFGIARAVEGTALTRIGGLIGTPGWISPEQYEGQAATDRSDMFAWGGMVAFAATGRNPFGKGASDALSYRTRTAEPDLDGVPDELLEVVRRSMDKDPARRPSAAQALGSVTSGWNATRVQPVPEEEPTRVLPAMIAIEWRGVTAPLPQRVRRPRRHAPLLALAAAVTAVVLLGAWWVVSPDPAGGPGTGSDTPAADEAGDSDVLAVVETPGDARAVLAQALDLAMAAGSFEAFRSHDAIEGSSLTSYGYTEGDRPVFLARTEAEGTASDWIGVGTGPDDILYRFALQGMSGDYEGDYYRDPDASERDRAMADRHVAFEVLERIASSPTDIIDLGEQPLPELQDVMWQYDVDDLPEDTGRHYSGDTGFTAQHWGLAAGGGRVLIDEPEASFDVWIGSDGYPLLVQYYYEYEHDSGGGSVSQVGNLVQLGYLQFNEPVEIFVPGEDQIGDVPDFGF